MFKAHQFSDLFLNDIPMMDVRAPIEFEKGAFPASVNCPLMSDAEREAVGTCYKENGQQAAIALGHQLVQGNVKAQRVASWQSFAEQNPNGILYCFRGGMRSQIVQQWLRETGIEMDYVEGGYKALRQYLIDQLQQRISQGNIYVLSGATGSGKTEVIHRWPHSVDLEGLANHRGSAFGSTGTEQPSQIDFENAWSVDWLKRVHQSAAPVLFEDESRLIGRIAVIPEFLALTKQAPIVHLKASLEERIARIREDYFVNAYQQQLPNGEEAALAYLDNFIRSALNRIQKRLGGERHQQLLAVLDESSALLKSTNQWSRFDTIIEVLLNDYYDPMYNYQYSKKAQQQIAEGDSVEVLEWLAAQPNN